MVFQSTQYPSIGDPFGGWRRTLPPYLSFIILIILIITVFILGAWFATEYIKIWVNTLYFPYGE